MKPFSSVPCAPRALAVRSLFLSMRPNEIAFSRRRSGAREASGAETGVKTLVEQTGRPRRCRGDPWALTSRGAPRPDVARASLLSEEIPPARGGQRAHLTQTH